MISNAIIEKQLELLKKSYSSDWCGLFITVDTEIISLEVSNDIFQYYDCTIQKHEAPFGECYTLKVKTNVGAIRKILTQMLGGFDIVGTLNMYIELGLHDADLSDAFCIEVGCTSELEAVCVTDVLDL